MWNQTTLHNSHLMDTDQEMKEHFHTTCVHSLWFLFIRKILFGITKCTGRNSGEIGLSVRQSERHSKGEREKRGCERDKRFDSQNKWEHGQI